MDWNYRFVWVGALVALSGPAAHAASLAITSVDPTAAAQLADNYSGTLGFQFTVAPTATDAITALGVYDNQNLSTTSLSYAPPNSSDDGTDDGLVTSHTVYVFDVSVSNAVPVASATIAAGTTGSPSTANFAFASLAVPLVLIPGDTYQIAENVVAGDGDFWLYNPTSFSQGTDFSTFVGAYGNTGAYLVNVGGPPYLGPNFQFTAVPEPMTAGLIGVASMVLVGRRARRSCAK